MGSFSDQELITGLPWSVTVHETLLRSNLIFREKLQPFTVYDSLQISFQRSCKIIRVRPFENLKLSGL